jgi:hypothetical protein
MKIPLRLLAAIAIALGIISGLARQSHAQLSCPGAEQVSVGLSSTAPDFANREPAVPPSGNFILFSSRATNLSSAFVVGTSSNSSNIYRYSPGSAIELISVNTAGIAPSGPGGSNLIFGSLAPAVTGKLADGSYGVAFHSDALDLVSPVIDGSVIPTQVYLRLPKQGRAVLISRDYLDGNNGNLPGNQNSEKATVAIVSSDSTSTKYRVCYQSLASNIVDGENENGQVIYCRDITLAGDTITEDPTLIIKPVPFNEQDKELGKPTLSADGKVLAFESNATIISNRPKNAYFQIYTYTFETQSLRLISSNASGFPALGNSTSPSISGDGSSIGFKYNAQSLGAPADLKGLEGISSSVFVKHTVSSGVNSQVNTNASGTPSNGQVHEGRIDTKSQYAVFSDSGSNITTTSDGIYFQVYLKSLITGEIVRTSVTSASQAGNEDSGLNTNPAFAAPLAIGHTSTSQDSPFVSFVSAASNLASVGAPDTTKPFIFRSLVVTPTPTPTPTSTPTPTPTPTPRTLTNQIRISEPPTLTILQKSPQGLYDLQIVCEEFSLDPLKIKNYPELVELLASSKARLTYSIDIRKVGSSKRITRVSTRNSVTVRKLTPGRYTVRYSVIATKGNKRIQSRVSPRASITLS